MITPDMDPTDLPPAPNGLLTMDDLLSAANDAVAEFDVDDGRVAPALTERNVRYYVTLGLVRPAIRAGGRSLWTRDHVNDLIRIRRAQATGQSLKLIQKFRTTPDTDAWRVANVARDSRMLVSAALTSAQLTDDEATPGWSIRLGDSLTLSGFTARKPTTDELRAVRTALTRLIDG